MKVLVAIKRVLDFNVRPRANGAGKEKFVGWNSGVHTFDGENPGYMLDSRYNAI